MAGDILVSGDTLVDEQGRATGLTLRGNLTISGAGNVLKTPHDALYAFAADMGSNGTLVGETAQDVGAPRWSLADGATQRVKWMWPIPVGWEAIAVRFGWDNESAGAGDVVWQFSQKMIYLGEGNVDGATVTDYAIGAITAGGQFDFNYSLPNAIANIATPSGGLGDKPFIQCSLSRLGGDGADTLAGAAAVIVATATRLG